MKRPSRLARVLALALLHAAACAPPVATEPRRSAIAPDAPSSEVTSKAPPSTDRAAIENVGYIVGGKKVPPGTYPFAVALARRNLEGRLWQYCGGALLERDVVLTAAHCRVAVGDVAVVGREDLTKSGGYAIRVAEVVPHEAYDPSTHRNDIALLRLANAVPPQYRTILASAGVAHTGQSVTAIGWGRTSESGASSLQLLETTVMVVAAQDCASAYAAHFRIVDGMLCAAAPGTDACQGDSGGPLFVKTGAGWEQVGITSFGIGCAQPSFPGVYTHVASYSQWIATHLRK